MTKIRISRKIDFLTVMLIFLVLITTINAPPGGSVRLPQSINYESVMIPESSN